MSQPRAIYANSTYMVTRRTTQRQFLLRPERDTNDTLKYILAIGTARYGIDLHAVMVMSNHYHLVLTDPRGQLPAFEQYINAMSARALNARYGRFENLWATEAPSYVRLINAEDMLEKSVYALSNPVKDGLVSHGQDWPGLRMLEPGRYKVVRPATKFFECGGMQEVVELRLVPLPLGGPAHAAIRQLREAVAAKEAELRVEARATGRRYLGAARVLAQQEWNKPRSVEPRYTLSPQVACRNTADRVRVIRQCKEFVARYREALRAWIDKATDVVFPVGTYLLAQRFGVSVEAAPS